MLKGIFAITGAVGNVLADYDVTFTSPPQDNTLRMNDGSTLALELAEVLAPGDTLVVIQGAGGTDISGTMRGQTAVIVNAETVSCVADTSAGFGLLQVVVSPVLAGAHAVGEGITLGRVTIANIPATTADTEKAPKNQYTTKLPEFGFLIARHFLPTRPQDGWTVHAVHRHTGNVLQGRIGKVTGGAVNVFVWVGDP